MHNMSCQLFLETENEAKDRIVFMFSNSASYLTILELCSINTDFKSSKNRLYVIY